MGDLDLHVTEGWLRRGYRPINPKTLTAEATETVTASNVEPAIAYRQTYGSTPGKTLVAWSDLTLLGTYAIPAAQQPWVTGLTHRWVGGESYPRLYTISGPTGGTVYESRPVGPPGNKAAMTTLGVMGQPTIRPPAGNEGADQVTSWGLHWDELGQRLYWAQMRRYAGEYYPHWGYATLTTGTPSAYAERAVFSCHTYGYDTLWHWGVTGLPQWFADQYCAGRRLLIGFGYGAQSPQSARHHLGLACWAVNPPDLARDSTPYLNGYIYAGGMTQLAGHDWRAGVRMLRGRFGGDWFTYAEAGMGATGGSYLSHRDNLCGAVWIDTPTKHGLLITGSMVESVWAPNARTKTATAVPAGSHTITVVDPPTGLLVNDLIWIQTQYQRVGGNGVFGRNDWPAPPGDPTVPGGPYGECVRVTGVTGNTITFERSNSYSDIAGGLAGACSVGAWVIHGCAYFDAIVPVSRYVPQVMCFDPTELGQAALGQRSTAVGFSWQTDQPFPDQPRVAKGGNPEEMFGHIADWTFDAQTQRLYGLRCFGSFAGSTLGSCIYVWQVN